MIRIRALIVALVLAPTMALAQDDQPQADVTTGLAGGRGALLRGLDKISGAASNIELGVGQSVDFGFVTVNLRECRYPADDPASDAYAFLTITEKGKDTPAFSGWMIASSPALSALDHPRYDIWVIRCKSN